MWLVFCTAVAIYTKYIFRPLLAPLSGEILYTTGGVLTFVHKLDTSNWITDIDEVIAGRCTRVELFREKNS